MLVGPFGNAVELAEVVGDPLVVELGQNQLLHPRNRDLEVGLVRRAFRRRRERQLGTRLCTDQPVVEVLGHPALADLVGPVLGVESGHRLAVAERSTDRS